MNIQKFSLKLQGDTKITEHFKVKEFACKDGSDEIIIDIDLVKILEQVRQWTREPVIVVSGYRTESYNNKINGATNSFHCKGQACDIRVLVEDVENLAICGACAGAKGIGIYYKDNFVHLDTRENLTIWRDK